MTDLHSLFQLNPLSHTKDTLDDLISQLRSMRSQFNVGNMKAGKTKPKTEKEKVALSIADKLDLGGLDL